MKTLKNILIFSVFNSMFMISSCSGILSDIMCPPVKKPNDLKPINWKEYNDVNTVYWNLFDRCKDVNWGLEGDSVKIFGFIVQFKYQVIKVTGFSISDKVNVTSKDRWIDISCFEKKTINKLQLLFDSIDLTKKCYIKGILYFNEMPTQNCCSATPGILINEENDIYFEN
ncbi:MAG: hypothetical protein Q7U47_14380 [Paludibacter sp.]|nr:hypothetical protein [Paludibacter sp.]